MSNYRRAKTQGRTYFFTVVTYRRQGFLCNESVRRALREGIHHARKEHPFTIDAWVLLPDHLHFIWTLPCDDADFGIRWAIIKRFVTKQCNPELKRDDWMKPSKIKRKESTLWQRRFWEHQIRDDKDYEKHVDYIHYNPVKHGLAKQASDWPFSTFHRYREKGLYEIDWAGISTDDEFGDVGEP
jgi:putative transposase